MAQDHFNPVALQTMDKIIFLIKYPNSLLDKVPLTHSFFKKQNLKEKDLVALLLLLFNALSLDCVYIPLLFILKMKRRLY